MHLGQAPTGKPIICFAFRFVEQTLPELHRQNHHIGIWYWLTDLNRRGPAYKAGALPAELNQQITHFNYRLFKPFLFQLNTYALPSKQGSLL